MKKQYGQGFDIYYTYKGYRVDRDLDRHSPKQWNENPNQRYTIYDTKGEALASVRNLQLATDEINYHSETVTS